MGDCSGCTMEVDKKPSALKVLSHGRIKVLLEESQEFPPFIPLSIDDLLCYVKVEVDTTGNDYGNRVGKSSDPEVEDDDFSRGLLNFKSCFARYEWAFPKLSQEKAWACIKNQSSIGHAQAQEAKLVKWAKIVCGGC